MDTATLRLEHDRLKAEATLRAGDLLDIPRRVDLFYNLYRDSGRNHAFSQIAAHGALWAFRNFADQQERIAKGMRAYDYAARAGWPQVAESMRAYGVMPRQFLS